MGVRYANVNTHKPTYHYQSVSYRRVEHSHHFRCVLFVVDNNESVKQSDPQ